ncbi:MAG TPA: PAS domain S-box protein [Anaerolineales bacterium]|nr:PAS domain S-box protein [Anaerolineales bacterium]
MKRSLTVLLIEDSEEDARLIFRELQRSYEVEFERVETAEAMRVVLPEKTWDLILSDYTMPAFSALQALEVLQGSGLDVPFIIVSGTMGEEAAVTALKAGVNDFLIKGKLDRLGAAIECELQEAQSRRERRQAEKTLQTTEEIFGTAFQHSPVGICITTLDGRLQNVSQSLVNMLGFTRAELEGKHFNDITHPDDLEIGRNAVGRMMAGKIPSISFEKRYLPKHGEPVWALVSSSLLRDPSGQPVHFITHILNMTERKRAEEAVLASEARYHQILDAMMEGCQIIGFDWRYVYVNDVLVVQGKRTREDLLNHTMMEVYPGIENTKLFATLKQCMEERTSKRLENPFVFPDSSMGWFELSIQPAQEGIFILSTDITERKHAEQQLLFHASIVGSASDAIIGKTTDGTIISWNPGAESLYGYKAEEVIGKSITIISPPERLNEFSGIFEKIKRGERIKHFETVRLTKDGQRKNVSLTVSPILDQEGKVLGASAIGQDITQRKEAEEALRAKNEEIKRMSQQLWQAAKLATLGELAASIAHELNNPLAIISLRTELLQSQFAPDDAQFKSLQVIESEVSRMSSLVANLLQFSRRSSTQVSTINVNEEIVNTLELIQYHLRQNSILIVQELSPDISLVQADRQQLRQVFLNLFTNAADAMPLGGMLTIRTWSGEKPDAGITAPLRRSATQSLGLPVPDVPQVFIEVSDTGEGIPPDKLKRIWEAFYTTKPEGKGTGLGLAICKRIMQEHGGTIEVSSDGIPGKGTMVRLSLPAVKDS